eukprot:NODE_6_length_48303_cov_0.387022.p14 type:complete len:243 gc:universal NODE_6_length_48303_cov_0.387022:16429-17157(+)
MLEDLIEASFEEKEIKIERRLHIPVTDYQEFAAGGKYISLDKLLNLHRIPAVNWYTVGVVQIIEKSSFELSDMKGLSIKCINHIEPVNEGDVVAVSNPIWRQNLMIQEKGNIHYIGKTGAIRCRQCKRLTIDVLCSVHLRESIQDRKNERQNVKTSSSVFQFEKKEFKKPEILDKSTEDFFDYISKKNDRVSNLLKRQTRVQSPKNYSNPMLKQTAFYKIQEKKNSAKAVDLSSELLIDFDE